MRLLLISNSTNAGEAYLDYPKHNIKNFLGDVKEVLFIPYAGVTFSFDKYVEKVQERFDEIGLKAVGIHTFDNPIEAIKNAQAIVVGGGNTWQLLRMIHDNNLTEAIREKVVNGTPYIGWSAGSNMACPTIKTTNDMPIIDPKGFNALELIPFQINPHYLDANPDGHAGETREMRIEEFLEVNQDIFVAGLREGTMIKVEGETMKLIGEKPLRIFKYGQKPYEVQNTESLNFLGFM